MAPHAVDGDAQTPVGSIRHRDRRVNIPTGELRDFLPAGETAQRDVLYPRDPSLDPQLVSKGKDQQDREDLTAASLPIYIHEKIHPQALVEDLRSLSDEGRRGAQMTLFADFNGIRFEDMVDFYRHEQNWSNRLVLGDSLQVMVSLADREGLRSKVQMVFMDPPYGIKFGSNWQVSTRRRDVRDGRPDDITRQPEQVRAFRDTWRLGIHSYLAYLRDRLVAAHALLTPSGSLFIQIGDENVHLVRSLLDEVFGSQNFIALIPFRKKNMPLGAGTLENMCDYLLWYARDLEQVKYRQLYMKTEPDRSLWRFVELADGTRRTLTAAERAGEASLPTGARLYTTVSQLAPSFSDTGVYDLEFRGKTYRPPPGQCWVTTPEKTAVLARANRLQVDGELPRYILYHDDFGYQKLTNPWLDTGGASDKVYAVQTNTKVLERCLLMATDPGDLVLDPTCGSGTTAYVAEQWGRRWITIDTSRVALALARTRLMSARYPFYLLSDSPEGAKKEAEVSAHPMLGGPFACDVRKGFVYRRLPHVTMRSIANNPEVDAVYARWQHRIDGALSELNKLTATTWSESEVPHCPDDAWSEPAQAAHARFQELRNEQRREMQAAIIRHADVQMLYDEPYEDGRRVRVSGPFTVEGLSPHRVLPASEDVPLTKSRATTEPGVGQFESMILDHLRRSGVQNTRKGERLRFARLEPFAGTWLHATGEYLEGEQPRRVGVCIGPEHGTVSPDLVKEAAKEAVQGVGFDLLMVCGFAFDPLVTEETRRYGKLTILVVRMNPDLAMGDELLKNTGAGNLFMVFGEPDLDIAAQTDGQYLVGLRGVDLYDPTTGQIRSASPNDIACWFIDTNYNGESFFVRHAYFTGGGEPYDRLKRALRAEIDESAWASLYSTISRPFPAPATGRIAVKIINHYGDEVMKIYSLSKPSE